MLRGGGLLGSIAGSSKLIELGKGNSSETRRRHAQRTPDDRQHEPESDTHGSEHNRCGDKLPTWSWQHDDRWLPKYKSKATVTPAYQERRQHSDHGCYLLFRMTNEPRSTPAHSDSLKPTRLPSPHETSVIDIATTDLHASHDRRIPPTISHPTAEHHHYVVHRALRVVMPANGPIHSDAPFSSLIPDRKTCRPRDWRQPRGRIAQTGLSPATTIP